jgi:CRISPR-associated exonuclease Cas4
MFSEDDLLPISSLQHITFCERQWALIHMEGEWSENVLTVEGRHLHDFVHEEGSESRAGIRMSRGLRLRSLEYGLYGVADMVEFHPSQDGIGIKDCRGLWRAYPVEYKRGRKRYDRADEIQVCAQAVCLEEMLGASIKIGAIYYGQPRRRTEVDLSADLRRELQSKCERARELLSLSEVPRPNIGRHCKSCSLVSQCMPDLMASDRSTRYMASVLDDLTSLQYKEMPY